MPTICRWNQNQLKISRRTTLELIHIRSEESRDIITHEEILSQDHRELGECALFIHLWPMYIQSGCWCTSTIRQFVRWLFVDQHEIENCIMVEWRDMFCDGMRFGSNVVCAVLWCLVLVLLRGRLALARRSKRVR